MATSPTSGRRPPSPAPAAVGWRPPAVIKIVVTLQDIARGERHNATKDPIAHAACRITGGSVLAADAAVGDLTLMLEWPIEDPGHVWSYVLPPEAREFVQLFDHTGHAEPIEFECSHQVEE